MGFPRPARTLGGPAAAVLVLNCGALLAQLPLAGRLQPMLGGSYVLATGAALVVLMLARFVVCDRWLYHPAGAQARPRPGHNPAPPRPAVVRSGSAPPPTATGEMEAATGPHGSRPRSANG